MTNEDTTDETHNCKVHTIHTRNIVNLLTFFLIFLTLSSLHIVNAEVDYTNMGIQEDDQFTFVLDDNFREEKINGTVTLSTKLYTFSQEIQISIRDEFTITILNSTVRGDSQLAWIIVRLDHGESSIEFNTAVSPNALFIMSPDWDNVRQEWERNLDSTRSIILNNNGSFNLEFIDTDEEYGYIYEYNAVGESIVRPYGSSNYSFQVTEYYLDIRFDRTTGVLRNRTAYGHHVYTDQEDTIFEITFNSKIHQIDKKSTDTNLLRIEWLIIWTTIITSAFVKSKFDKRGKK